MLNFRWFLKPNSLLVWCLLAGIGLLLLFDAVSLDILRLPLSETTRAKFRLYDGIVVDLFQGNRIEQSFIANYPGLTQIDILFLGSDHSQLLTFHLKHNCDAVVDIVDSPAELLPQDGLFFQTFTFPPIDDSAGQSYCVILEAPEATSETPVRLQLSSGDLYPYGNVTANDSLSDADKQRDSAIPKSTPAVSTDLPYKIFLPIVLSEFRGVLTGLEDVGFLLHYRGPVGPTSQLFFARLTADKPYIWGQAWFYGILIILYLILLSGLFLLVRRMIQVDLQE